MFTFVFLKKSMIKSKVSYKPYHPVSVFGRWPIVVLIFLLFLTGCSDQSGNRKPVSEIQIRATLDSLRFIDSMVMLTRVKDTGLTHELARSSLRIAGAIETGDALLKAYNINGNAWSLSRMDSAFYYYSKALAIKQNQPDFPEKPMLLYNIAMLNVAAGNQKNAVGLLDSAIQAASRLGKFEVVSNALNSLGGINLDLGQRSQAIRLYDSALRTADLHQLPLQKAIALGNLARTAEDIRVTIQYEREAVSILKQCKDGAEPLASTYINAGFRMTNPDSAIASYLQAIRLINRENAPLTLLTAYNNLAYGFLEKGDIRQAKRWLSEFAFPLARDIQNDGWLANLHDTYADVLSAEGNYKEALQNEKKSVELANRADRKAADHQVRLLGAMLDLKNQEARTRAAQQEAERTKSNYSRAKFWFSIVLLTVLFLAAALAFFLVRKIAVARGILVSAAKKIILVEENEKSLLGRELHDLTGHKLVNVVSFMEMASFENPEEQSAGMTMVTDLQDQFRRLSHRLNQNWLEKFGLHRNLEALCREFIKYNQIDLAFSQPSRYPELQPEMAIHLFRITQELLTNAAKYAKTARISLEISLERNRLLLKYADDGPGFDREAVADHGIGIIHIYERTRLMHGEAILDTRPGYGVSWEIGIPLHASQSLMGKISGGKG